MEKVSLALVGATGIVGQEILSVLSDEAFDSGEIQLCASDDSVGEVYDFKGKDHEVVSPDNLKLNKSTLSVLCSPRDVSENLLPNLRSKSLAVLDCSGIDRESNKLKLMPDAIVSTSKDAAYSIRSSAGYMIDSYLSALNNADQINSIVATILEPVSGAGRSGLDELWNQTKSIFNQTAVEPEFFPEQISFNVISQVDVLREDGGTAFEQRVAEELRTVKNLKCPITVTALRVPIMYGTGISLTLEVNKKVQVEEICEAVSASPRFVLDQDSEQPPSTLSSVGDDRVHIARIRINATKNSTIISCWLVADNIRACIARPVVDLYRTLMPPL